MRVGDGSNVVELSTGLLNQLSTPTAWRRRSHMGTGEQLERVSTRSHFFLRRRALLDHGSPPVVQV